MTFALQTTQTDDSWSHNLQQLMAVHGKSL